MTWEGSPCAGGTTLVAAEDGMVRYAIARPLPGAHLSGGASRVAEERQEALRALVQREDDGDPSLAWSGEAYRRQRALQRRGFPWIHNRALGRAHRRFGCRGWEERRRLEPPGPAPAGGGGADVPRRPGRRLPALLPRPHRPAQGADRLRGALRRRERAPSDRRSSSTSWNRCATRTASPASRWSWPPTATRTTSPASRAPAGGTSRCRKSGCPGRRTSAIRWRQASASARG